MFSNSSRCLKSSVLLKTLVTIVATVLCMAHFTPGSRTIQEKVDFYYQDKIYVLRSQLTELRSSSQNKSSLKILQQKFLAARLTYKKIAVLTEYFNIYESKFLNGPALNRSEDGTPDIIIQPKGFQAIEEIVFTEEKTIDNTELNEQLDQMLVVLIRLENEIDRSNKFTQEAVWDALRAAVIRVAALGITGYDSPIATYSLYEAKASIEGIKDLLVFFKSDIELKSPGSWDCLTGLLDQASRYLVLHENFNGFDRLHFISTYINPFYKQLLVTRLETGISVPGGRNPVNLDAESIFQADFFDINFFSPGKDYWTTAKRAELGKKLFSDPVLSGTKNRSCASCHSPEKAFTDGMRVPLSADGKSSLYRNTPTLWNSAWQTRQFFDVRTDILENQLKEVVHNTDEMRGSLIESVAALKTSPEYVQYFAENYPNEKEPLNAFNIANAISSYIRTLISLNSRFDQYMAGDKSTLTVSEKRGFNLFTGKGKCATCHFIPLFNGLVPPEFNETETEVLGVPVSKEKTNAKLDTDPGKYDISRSVIHKFSFKTPTLRNIALTAPYMHNGVFDTLEEVMDFYNEGGGAGLNIAPDNQTLPKDKLKLSKKEMNDIIGFMKSLTDQAALHYKN